jgi:uncharacterized protein (DUF1697 family)
MALVVFLRGVNVGGHRTFRPSVLAKELRGYEVVNVGAAGTFVVRKPVSAGEVRAMLLRKLQFEAEVMICEGRDVTGLVDADPFASEPAVPDVVRFVSVLSKAARAQASLPIVLPANGPWLLRIIGFNEAGNGRFIFGMYRRQMKAIGYLGQIDKLLGAVATTRSWNTITAIARILRNEAAVNRKAAKAAHRSKIAQSRSLR